MEPFAPDPEPVAAAPLELMTVAEVAALLRVSTSWLYLAAADGRIPALRIGGPDGPVRFDRAELGDYIARCVTGPAPVGGSGPPAARLAPRARGEHRGRR